mmetsp:Transcript_35797/g.26584  ORF Transcript_35797/g.26584 Transcript_35797/m.26584 type:complete len:217 (+) Transcript_35797:1318-1968(+)|eukprot:CAMPEP_0202963980 /NCGR_PEP_ID=MMETSP1396-20130829/8038_1 /ASSEMBLY_ACC=CAM_ASM_000872 /TAXON_ID= /ORGANISM="Pseudokeronopsis sp., Strain Brazil" /LENGTH=216 /DNA_ID=CAMNT_0049685691 /DNA_START=1210 /DNA_END=1860 /DNA_ORIENTATION=-
MEIIYNLAEDPLRKPKPPKVEDEGDKGHIKTKMLELVIFRISTLLQRGFGELGAKIVSRTLTTNEQYMDLFQQGKKVSLVFAKFRIRQFTETTDSLQDEIIVFVNKVVKIIHECAKRWDGAPTKNFGDRYLITWKLPHLKHKKHGRRVMIAEGEEEAEGPNAIHQGDEANKELLSVGEEGGGSKEEEEEKLLERRTEIADKAFVSAVKTIVELRRA